MLPADRAKTNASLKRQTASNLICCTAAVLTFIGGTFNCHEDRLDPAKRQATLTERGLHFEDAAKVFAGRTLTDRDVRFAYDETRFQTVGFLDGRMVMVVWTPRGNARHVISMRKCNERERPRYQKRLEEG